MPTERPEDATPLHTADLPATPQQAIATIPARAWIEAPGEFTHLGDDIGTDEAQYKHRIGRWLLWRSGPATGADARYVVFDADDLSTHYTFRLFPDGNGDRRGEARPAGVHERFRTWKEDLRSDGKASGKDA